MNASRDDPLSVAALTVAEVLDRSSQAASVFLRFRMACVGCPMSRFETVETAALTYGITPHVLALEIHGCFGPRSEEEGGAAEPGIQAMAPENPEEE